MHSAWRSQSPFKLVFKNLDIIELNHFPLPFSPPNLLIYPFLVSFKIIVSYFHLLLVYLFILLIHSLIHYNLSFSSFLSFELLPLHPLLFCFSLGKGSPLRDIHQTQHIRGSRGCFWLLPVFGSYWFWFLLGRPVQPVWEEVPNLSCCFWSAILLLHMPYGGHYKDLCCPQSNWC